MKTIECKLQALEHEVELYIIGDTHIGSSQFNEPLLVDFIAYILEKKNRYVILNGDICDCTFINSKGNIYENEMTPQVALSYACKTLKPLVDEKRVLCTIGGNHDDDRSMRLVGISLAQQMATLLGIPDLYSPDSVVLLCNVKDGIRGKKSKEAFYSIFISHGNNGNGTTIGANANSLEKMNIVVPTADVYIHNHTHKSITFKDEYVSIDTANRCLVWRERLYVNGNAFMKYFNSYAEKRLMKPQSQSIPKIKLKTLRNKDKNNDRIYKTMSCEI